MTLPHDSYLEFIREEYLDTFIRDGGAAVKFVVMAEPAAADRVHAALKEQADAAGYVYASVDAATTKMSMIDRVFHAVAAQVPWRELARAVVVRALAELRFAAPADEPLSLAAIARYNDYDFQQLRKDFNRRLRDDIYHDYELAHDFRIAMILLCQAEVSGAPAEQTTAAAVEAWLKGELRHISQLKPELIYQKIVRSNALHMLYSLGPWVRKAGRTGLVLDLDIRQCAVPNRALTEHVYYTRPAVLDVYELLRQLVDATDELRSTFVLVMAGTEFLADPARGLERYWALRLRILDEVRDRQRTNPYSALVRLTRAPAPRVEAHA
jgi:hypothetical protein